MGQKLRSGYGIVHRCVMEYEGLSRDAKALYALLQSYTGAQEVCWPSIETLSKGLCCSERSIQNWKTELVEKGLLCVTYREGTTDIYEPLIPRAEGGVQPGAPGGEPAFTQGVQPGAPRRLTMKNNNEDSMVSTKPLSGKPDDMPSEFYFQVIDYLNDTTGSRYRDNTPATRRMINQRWREGFRADDFQAVIDGRWEEWKDKKEMVQYMRPETLFCAKHFESYLQAAKSRRVL